MASDESSDDANDNYYFDEEPQGMDPELVDDLSQVILIFGQDSLTYRQLTSIDIVDIYLHIRTSLQADISEAWGLFPSQPIILKLSVSFPHYRNGNKPTVLVYQYWDGDPKKQHISPICHQLTKILEAFIARYWTKNTSDKSDVYSDDDLSALLDMGFAFDDCQNALRESSNKQQAVDMLLFQQQLETSNMRTSQSFTLPKRNENEKLPKSKTIQNMSDARLTLIPSSTEQGLKAKTVPPVRNGFFVQVMDYMLQRIPTLNEFCVVCDDPHVFQNGAMLKPAVCSRELCVFAYGTLGVMADAAADIASGAEVIDLLVNLFLKSATCKRKTLVLDPFPTILDPIKPNDLAFHERKKDWKKLEKLVTTFPKTSELFHLDGLALKNKMDIVDPLTYPLLKWIIHSNRSHIVRLPPDKQLEFMHTPHQFLLLCAPPAKEAKFRAAKREHGSSFALHGSAIENWHSILRNGLMVATGTRHQLDSAAKWQKSSERTLLMHAK